MKRIKIGCKVVNIVFISVACFYFCIARMHYRARLLAERTVFGSAERDVFGSAGLQPCQVGLGVPPLDGLHPHPHRMDRRRIRGERRIRRGVRRVHAIWKN